MLHAYYNLDYHCINTRDDDGHATDHDHPYHYCVYRMITTNADGADADAKIMDTNHYDANAQAVVALPPATMAAKSNATVSAAVNPCTRAPARRVS